MEGERLKTMYNKIVLDHFQNPRNLEEMKNADATGMGASQICGDVMTLFLQSKNSHIEKASFTTVGCGAAIAAGSLLTEMLKGKTIDEANKISPQTLVEALGGLPKIKLHCPDLAIEALHSALKNLEKKK
jgi:nitrogen fixation protein NifU and related proteins